jgi:hypothetical protein
MIVSVKTPERAYDVSPERGSFSTFSRRSGM